MVGNTNVILYIKIFKSNIFVYDFILEHFAQHEHKNQNKIPDKNRNYLRMYLRRLFIKYCAVWYN